MDMLEIGEECRPSPSPPAAEHTLRGLRCSLAMRKVVGNFMSNVEILIYLLVVVAGSKVEDTAVEE
jgi:hypothetical protein